MENKYVWAVEDIYKSVLEWSNQYDELAKNIDFSEFKGKLGQKDSLLSFFKEEEKVYRKIEKLSVYAMMNHDKDTRNSVYDRMVSKTTSLCADISSKTAYVVPELTSLSDEKLKSYIISTKQSDW